MTYNKNNINGYILAGGKSSRMGADKGLMLLNGQPVINYIIDALQPVVNKVIIVSNNTDYKEFGLDVIADEIKGIGPAGGIFSALHDSNKNDNFIVSCDMPFVTSAAIGFIIQNGCATQVTLPVYNHQLEPLFGVYTKECLEGWKRLIGDGVFKLHEMLTHFNLKQLNVDGNELFNASLFMNLNTKEDFENAVKQI